MGEIDIAKNLGKLGQNLAVYHFIPLAHASIRRLNGCFPGSSPPAVALHCLSTSVSTAFMNKYGQDGRSRLLLSLCFCREILDLFLSNDGLSISYLWADRKFTGQESRSHRACLQYGPLSNAFPSPRVCLHIVLFWKLVEDSGQTSWKHETKQPESSENRYGTARNAEVSSEPWGRNRS